MAFWSVEVKPDEPYVHEPSSRGRLRITQATLGNYDNVGWTTLECSTVGDTRPAVRLCTLNHTTVMYRLDLEYEEKQNIVLSVQGTSSVHLSGYYIKCQQHDAHHGTYTDKPSSAKTSSHAYIIKRESSPGHGITNVGSLTNPILCDGADDDYGGDHFPLPFSPSTTSTSKKRKSKTPSIQVAATDYQDSVMDSANKQRHDKTMVGEILIENLEWGDLKDEVASKGKKVRVKYVGKLEDGNAFDPTEGSEIHEFELGAGQVILGWEQGIDGMHVGGKRRLTIPPALGYGDRPLEEIPANSCLIYDVELLSVSN